MQNFNLVEKSTTIGTISCLDKHFKLHKTEAITVSNSRTTVRLPVEVACSVGMACLFGTEHDLARYPHIGFATPASQLGIDASPSLQQKQHEP